jgi:transcriptional regulator with XRE-family HTH domain
MLQSVHAANIALNAIICQADSAACAYPLQWAVSDALRMSNIANIGQSIDRLRRARGLNKKELSALSGIDAGNLNRIISGKQEPTYARMQALAAVFGVNVSTIYRMAETGMNEEEDRKAFLHALIDAAGADQVDAIFRRWPNASHQQRDTAAPKAITGSERRRSASETFADPDRRSA